MISEVAYGRCLPWVDGVGVAGLVWTRGSGRLRLFVEQVAGETGPGGEAMARAGDATVKQHNKYFAFDKHGTGQFHKHDTSLYSSYEKLFEVNSNSQ